MNGSSTGVIPTYDISGNGNNGWGGNMGEWILGIVALGMLSNGTLFGGNGGNGANGMYPWLMSGQAGINQNTNYGFDTLHLSNQIEGVRDGVAGLSNQICNTGNAITSAINTTAYNSEIAAANRQMANMNTAFDLSRQFADCCCENRLATCQTQNAIISEGSATRFADANNTRDIITNATSNTQAILDKLCQLELDGVKAQVEAKNDRIAELQTQLNMANLSASQVAQTAQLRLSEEQQFENFYNRLKNCPINAVSVYGNQPVYSCQPSYGCGCGNFTTSQFI
ncbi:MAG: hypothetical protein IKO78_02640 [Bacilli bacterium]|nr:hypothetical protein [Bacilli bacterium]